MSVLYGALRPTAKPPPATEEYPGLLAEHFLLLERGQLYADNNNCRLPGLHIVSSHSYWLLWSAVHGFPVLLRRYLGDPLSGARHAEPVVYTAITCTVEPACLMVGVFVLLFHSAGRAALQLSPSLADSLQLSRTLFNSLSLSLSFSIVCVSHFFFVSPSLSLSLPLMDALCCCVCAFALFLPLNCSCC
jgi:hypothetical protein